MLRLATGVAGLVALLGIGVMGGCSVVGIRTTEEPPFTLLAEDGAIEVRRYEDTLIAETVVEEMDYGESGSVGFRRLGGFIFGDNVEPDTGESGRVSMTAPVIQEKRSDRWVMRFVMPGDHTEETLPRPTDPAVSIRAEPGRVIATLRYSGLVSEKTIAENTDRLKSWLAENGWVAVSPPRSARYDPPWTIPVFRRNEVMLDVRPASEFESPEPVTLLE